MKRVGNLIKNIFNIDNLYSAWIKARKNKIHQKEVLIFEKELDNNLIGLQMEIISGKLKIGNYNFFTITDPKKRTICAASFKERVLHHAIMNVCNDIFERHLIYDTYATRKGKGTYAALDRLKEFVKRYKYYVKLDVRKYFDNIEHNILKYQLSRLFKDQKLLNVFFKIIDSYSVSENRGVPIGNLTSQYFANHYLSIADHFAKEQLKLKGYIRYMDDIVFLDNDKTILKRKYIEFKKFVSNNLQLDLKPLVLDKTSNGIPFLGYKVFKYIVRLSQRSKLRFKSKLKEYEKYLLMGKWSEKEYHQHILPLLAFVEYADTIKLRKRIIWNTG